MTREKAVSGSRRSPIMSYERFKEAWERAGKPKNFTYTFQNGIGKRVMSVEDLQANLDEKINPSKALKAKRAYLTRKYGKRGK